MASIFHGYMSGAPLHFNWDLVYSAVGGHTHTHTRTNTWLHFYSYSKDKNWFCN